MTLSAVFKAAFNLQTTTIYFILFIIKHVMFSAQYNHMILQGIYQLPPRWLRYHISFFINKILHQQL